MLSADMDRELARSLYYAVDSGQHARVESLIKSGARTDHRTPGGWTTLLRAAFGGDVAMVEMLVRAGADPNQTGTSGQTALELCVLRGHMSLLSPLLEAHADPTLQDFGAPRRALEMHNIDALSAFGPNVIFQLYDQDQIRIREVEGNVEGSDSSGSNASREKARLKTLKGIISEESTHEEDDFTCTVCFEAPRSILLQPCRHFALCAHCAPQFKACPICRREVTGQIAVFLS